MNVFKRVKDISTHLAEHMNEFPQTPELDLRNGRKKQIDGLVDGDDVVAEIAEINHLGFWTRSVGRYSVDSNIVSRPHAIGYMHRKQLEALVELLYNRRLKVKHKIFSYSPQLETDGLYESLCGYRFTNKSKPTEVHYHEREKSVPYLFMHNDSTDEWSASNFYDLRSFRTLWQEAVLTLGSKTVVAKSSSVLTDFVRNYVVVLVIEKDDPKQHFFRWLAKWLQIIQDQDQSFESSKSN